MGCASLLLNSALLMFGSTTGARDPITSALQIVLGRRVPLDIAHIIRWRTTSESKVEPCVRYAASFAGYFSLLLFWPLHSGQSIVLLRTLFPFIGPHLVRHFPKIQ